MFKFSKYICILSILAAPFVFKPNAALAGGGFTASCQNIMPVTFLGRVIPVGFYAQCYNTRGQLSDIMYLEINSHITNNDGHLAWERNGGFAASVSNCGLDVSNVTVLHCDARRRDGSSAKSSITLDDEIANYNGNLTVLDGF